MEVLPTAHLTMDQNLFFVKLVGGVCVCVCVCVCVVVVVVIIIIVGGGGNGDCFSLQTFALPPLPQDLMLQSSGASPTCGRLCMAMIQWKLQRER